MTTQLEPATAAQVLLTQMHALGVDLDTLTAVAAGTTGPGATAVSTYLTQRVEPALTKGQRQAWRPYLGFIACGYPQVCACTCNACLETFASDSTGDPCPCVTRGRCHCRPDDLAAGPVAAGSCLEHCTGVGDRSLGSLRLADWEHLARWAQLRAHKRVVVRNRARGDAGRPTHAHDGRSAIEHLRNAASMVYRLALDDDVAGVRKNHALDLKVPPRPATVARAYTEAQLGELWQAIFTSGGTDPDLDMLLVWFTLKTGSRRGGPRKLTVGDLLFSANRVRLSEKNGKPDAQPVSRELVAALLGHALERGRVLREAPPELEPSAVTVDDVIAGRVTLRTDAPVFYYQHPRAVTRPGTRPDGTPVKVPVLDPDGNPASEPHPITRKRFETLWGRLRRELPWLDELHGRPHDLRKTMGTFIERAHGHAVARRWLRHTEGDVTGVYTAASDEEITAAHAWLLGRTG